MLVFAAGLASHCHAFYCVHLGSSAIILRIDGARSRPIILVERSASASPLEFALGAASSGPPLPCSDSIYDDVGRPTCRAERVPDDVRQSPHPLPPTLSAGGILSAGGGLTITRMQCIRRSRYVLRTCTPALSLVALPSCRWCAALAGNGLHQLHRLPASRTAQHSRRGRHR